MAYGLAQQWAGKLDRQVRLLRSFQDFNEMNEPIIVWRHVASIWADVQHQSAEEQFESQVIRAIKQTRFIMRWRTDITEKDRIEHDGQLYLITGLTEMGRRELLEVKAEYVQGANETNDNSSRDTGTEQAQKRTEVVAAESGEENSSKGIEEGRGGNDGRSEEENA